MRSCLFAVLACLTAACAGDSPEVQGDPTYYLTGTEEQARQNEDGSFDCESPRKVLICHIPPGNPDNAHTICVGAAAVRAHEENHGDPAGECDDGDDDGTTDDGTTDDGPTDDGTTDDGDDGSDDGDDSSDDSGDGEPGPDGGVPADPDAGVVDVD